MTDQIQRTASGSLDTAFYIAQCHRQRSKAAHARLTQFGKALRRVFGGLFYVVARLAR